MAFNAETAQNVEVSVKLPPELAPMEQLRLMERYTETHKAASALSKEVCGGGHDRYYLLE